MKEPSLQVRNATGIPLPSDESVHSFISRHPFVTGSRVVFISWGWGSPGGCSYLLTVLNSFPAHLALFSPVCLIWTNMPSNPILECTLLCRIAHPFTPSLAHQDHSILPWSLSVQPSPLYGPNRTVSETLLFESAHLCYFHFSLVILPFESLLTFCYFSPTSQFISKWSWILYIYI